MTGAMRMEERRTRGNRLKGDRRGRRSASNGGISICPSQSGSGGTAWKMNSITVLMPKFMYLVLLCTVPPSAVRAQAVPSAGDAPGSASSSIVVTGQRPAAQTSIDRKTYTIGRDVHPRRPAEREREL